MLAESGLIKYVVDFLGWVLLAIGTAILWLVRTLVFNRLDKLENRLGALENLANKGVTHLELSSAVVSLRSEISDAIDRIEESRKEIHGEVKEVSNDIKEVRNLIITQLSQQNGNGNGNGNRKA
jgi:hypothetical protein